MSSYSAKINLLKMTNACVVSVKGKSGSKKGVFIPIDDNNLFVSMDENIKAKGVYLDLNIWENKTQSQYGDTHSIKPALPKDVRKGMTEEQLKAIPYIGNMKPYEPQNGSQTVEAPQASVEENEDELPF